MLSSCRSILLSVAVLALASTAALGATMTVEGSLPKDPSVGKFELTITISGVSEADRKAGENDGAGNADAQFAARFKIVIPDMDSNPLPFRPEDATGNVRLYASRAQDFFETSEGVDAQGVALTKYVYYVTISDVTPGALATLMTNKTQLSIHPYFYLGKTTKDDANKTADVLATLTQATFVVDQAPTFNSNAIEGSQKSLKINWQHNANVTVKPAGSKASTRVTAIIVDKDAVGTVALPGKKFSGVPTTADTAATCTYAPLVTTAGGCVTCDPDVYLLEDEIAKIPGFFVRSANSSDGGLTVTGLQNEKNYTVFLQYEPDGIQRSLCVTGAPSPNFSLTELNGEGDAEQVDFRCFIATAAYGTDTHEDLDTFRRFRDGHLKNTAVGRAMVEAYYELSPPVADFIANHPDARDATRWGLEKIASLVRAVE